MTYLPPMRTSLWATFRDFCGWVIYEAHIEALELFTAINGFVWGVWIANPLVNIFATVPGFATMALVPQAVWGLFGIVASLTLLLGRLRGRPHWQRAGARALACLWMFVVGCLAYQNWRWPATVMYLMLAAGALLVSYRAIPAPRRPAERPLVGEDRRDG